MANSYVDIWFGLGRKGVFRKFRSFAIAGGTVLALTSMAGGTALAASPTIHVVEKTTTDSGVTITTLSNGAVIKDAPEGTEEARSKKCGSEEVCFWKKKNYEGHKLSISLPGKDCYTLVSGVFLVRSLKVGTQDGITAMRTDENCKGRASLSYVGGASVPSTEFPMESVR
ncbi:peptidase inhibitor family I36 protein [Archangium violaceum]|uniref:peptidase inhibitor family I36 protein n=1 Tax=Archangium violaceum TaxID=83451 RepID=UPI0036DF7A82